MRSQITGSILPVLEIGLDPGEMVVAPPGEFAWMTPNVRMNTTTAAAGSSGFSVGSAGSSGSRSRTSTRSSAESPVRERTRWFFMSAALYSHRPDGPGWSDTLTNTSGSPTR